MRTIEELDVNVRTKKDIYAYPSVVLWGAGFAYEDCITSIGKEHIKAVFDNDSTKWGKVIGGFEIKSPVTDWGCYVDNNTAIVISTNGYVYEIAENIVEKHPEVNKAQLFSNSNNVVEQFRYKPEAIAQNLDKIMRIKDLFCDQASKTYYINFLKACLSRNPFYFKDNPNCTKAYEYETDCCRVGLQGGEVILDCGAYNGDTARIFMEKTNNNCEIYCFEPVVENYKELRDWIEKEKLTNIHAIHSGVGKEKKIDYVYSTEEKTTKAAVGSNRFGSSIPVRSEIQVDTLDNMAEGLNVSYIKMDIEGAEMDALHGARKIIASQFPQMLISGYHKIEDMWEIPEFVLSIHPDYKMFLAHQPHAPYEPEFIFRQRDER